MGNSEKSYLELVNKIKMNNGLRILPLDMWEYNMLKTFLFWALGRYSDNSFLGPKLRSLKLYNECVYRTKHETLFGFMNFGVG